MPVAFVSAVPAIPISLGVPRVVRGVAITHVLGDPALPPAREVSLRRGLLETTVHALAHEVSEPTMFERELGVRSDRAQRLEGLLDDAQPLERSQRPRSGDRLERGDRRQRGGMIENRALHRNL